MKFPTRPTYQRGLDYFAFVGICVTLALLFNEYFQENCFSYSSDEARNLTSSVKDMLFDTSVVTILSKTCNAKNVNGLFTVLVLAAFFMQYLRLSIAWQQTQLQRCTLMTPKTKRKSPCWYHLLTRTRVCCTFVDFFYPHAKCLCVYKYNGRKFVVRAHCSIIR